MSPFLFVPNTYIASLLLSSNVGIFSSGVGLSIVQFVTLLRGYDCGNGDVCTVKKQPSLSVFPNICTARRLRSANGKIGKRCPRLQLMVKFA